MAGRRPLPGQARGSSLAGERTENACRRERRVSAHVTVDTRAKARTFSGSALASAHLCLAVLVETSSSRRHASSSCDKVLGGGRGGMAGSWTKGWAGWWLRRWPQLPPPPHV